MTTTPTTTAPAFAHRIAECFPHRSGAAWTAEAYQAWWTTRPAARLSQAGRPGALIVARHPWRTDIAWQLSDREPYAPDLRLDSLSTGLAGRETLRLVLPQLDDATAHMYAHSPSEAARERLRHLELIGSAVRAQGAATYNVVGAQPNSNALTWGTGSMKYSLTLIGANPACDLTVTGPVEAVERLLTRFLPLSSGQTPRFPLRGVRTRLGRRVAAHLGQFTSVDQLHDGGLSFGGKTGPFGYVAPPADPVARVRDTTPVAVELYGAGIDHLVHIAPFLSN